MRARETGQAIWHRMQRPATWGAVLLFGLAWNLVRWGLGGPPRGPLELASPFVWAGLFLTVTPVPWQWSGDEAPTARAWRGLLQAVPWNALWVLLLILALEAPSRGLPRGGMGRGPGMRMGPGSHGLFRPDRPWGHLPPRLLWLALTNLSVAVLLGWILAEKERAEILARESRRAAAQAQARALQSQMNPHVLFNAIGGLAELVREDPEAAERALVSLADLLRGLLEHGALAVAPLARERELVERYLALEHIRLGHRLEVDWQWEAALEGLSVPPLLLQPLVENAIKHGIAPNRAGGTIRISLRGEGEDLELEVANTGLPLDAEALDGVGLRNLRERLSLLGLPAGAFRLLREGPWTCARLRLPRSGRLP